MWTQLTDPPVVTSTGDSGILRFVPTVLFVNYGMYVCTASSNGLMVNSSMSTVYISPEFSVMAFVDDGNTTNGSRVNFTCAADGGPNNMFVWIMQTAPVNVSTISLSPPLNVSEVVEHLQSMYTVLQQGSDDEYVIDSVNATEHGGTYTCVVVNVAGFDSDEVELFVQPTITRQPESVLTSVEDSISLSCDADSFPPPTYSWLRQTEEGEFEAVSEDAPRLMIDENSGDLVITEVEYSDFGEYFCRANSSSGSADSALATITVSPNGSISVEPLLLNSTDGDDVQFECTAQGGPGNQFVWRYERTGEIVSSTQQLNLTSDESVGGQYQCEVFNLAGNDTASVTLNVGPEILQGPQAQNVTDFEGVIVLTCNVSGFPIPSITWWHNNTELMEEVPRVNITTVEYNENSADLTQFGRAASTLMIGTPNVNDSGDYACRANISSIAFYAPVTSDNVTVLVQNLPERPQDLMAVDLTSRNFTLTWVEPHDNNAPIGGYMVRFSDPPFLNSTQRTVNSSNEQQFIDNLHPGVTYSFTVTAFNEIGFGMESEPLLVITLDEVPASAPQNPSSTTLNATAIRVQWEEIPEIDQNGNITYEVRVDSAQFQNVSFENVSGSELMLVVDGLEEFVEYNFTIRAYTSAGPGPFSDVTTNTTNQAAPAAAPQNPSSTTLNATAIQVQWEKVPDIDENGNITYYEVQVDPARFQNVSYENVSGSERMLVVDGLEEFVVYNFTIRAYTIAGPGPFSTVTTSTTDTAAPAAAPQNPSSTTLNATAIQVEWEEVPEIDQNGNIIYYEVQVDPAQFQSVRYENVSGLERMLVVDGLEEFVEYNFTIRAYTSAGPGPFSNVTINTTNQAAPAAAPQNPSSTTLNATAIQVQWEEVPEIDRNGIIISYEVRVDPAQFQNVSYENVSDSELVLLVDGLEEFVVYNFTIRAYTSAGPGPFSNVTTNTTDEAAPAAAPQNPSSTTLSATAIQVQWEEVPEIDQNGIVTFYEVRVDPAQFHNVSYENVSGSERMLVVDGLEEFVEYNFTIRAYTIVGPGLFSNVTTSTTNQAAPAAAPQNLSSTTLNATAIQVQWEEVPEMDQNGNITYYEVRVDPAQFQNVSYENVSDSEFVLVVDGLEEFVEYNFTVRAYTIAGSGPFSNVTTSTTNESIPAASPLSLMVVTASANSLSVTWLPPPAVDVNGELEMYQVDYRIIEQLGFGTNIPENVGDIDTEYVNASTTNLTIDMLDNYTVYEVNVSAVTIGVGPAATEIERTDENVPSGPPQNVIAITTSTTSINVSWERPLLNESNGIIDAYRIRYFILRNTPTRLNETETPNLSNTTFSMEFTDLEEGTMYGFEILAVTVGDGPYSPVVFNETISTAPDVPPEPIMVEMDDNLSPREVRLSWNSIPILQQNGEILTYEVQVFDPRQTESRKKRNNPAPNSPGACFSAAGALSRFNLSVPGNMTSVNVSGLAPNSSYNFQVRGNTIAGFSNFSSPQGFETGEDVPEHPQSVTLTTLNSTALMVQWEVPICDNGQRIRYNISYENITDMSFLGNKESPFDQESTADRVTIRDLTPNTNYTVTVRACTAVGCGEGTTESSFTSEDAPQEVTGFSLMNDNTNINLAWTIPSDRNGTFDYIITFNARSSFNYPNHPDRIQEDSDDSILVDGMSSSHILENVLAFANYTVTITAFNRLRGRDDFSGPTVQLSMMSLAQTPSEVTNLRSITQNSSAILIQWGLPEQPNGTITSYVVTVGNTHHTIRSGTFFSLEGNPGDMISFTVHAEIGGSPDIEGVTSGLQQTLNTTVPFPDAQLIENSIGTLTITLPPASLYPDNGNILFYGVVLIEVLESTTGLSEVVDFGVEYPNPMPYQEGQTTNYYLTAAWNSMEDVPDTFIVGDNTETTANYQGTQHVFVNKGLSRRTPYHVFVIVHVDSGIREHPLIRFSSLVPPSVDEVETRLGYNEAALGFFLALIIVLLIAIVVIGVSLILYKKFKTQGYEITTTNGKEQEAVAGTDLVIVNPPTTEVVNGQWVDPSTSKQPIAIEDFPAHVANMHSNDDYLFSIEYPSLEPKHSPTTEATHHPDNAVKNRYANITSYDHSRVKLKEIPNVPGSDYINANYLDGYRKENAFIASQGPVPHSIIDFWRMVWEQASGTIVMLTGLEEKGRIKCHKYWPNDDKRVMVYGNIRVHLQEILILSDHTIRTFSLHHNRSQDERIVKQFHFTAWPDFGVPEHPTPLLRFIRKVSSSNPMNAGPMVVHCSAGVGRTGTFCTILSQMKRISDVGTVDIFNFVQSMRYRRCFMVQTEPQYIFIHDALLEVLECGETEVVARDVKEQYRKLGSVEGESGRTLLDIEFEKIQATIHSEPFKTFGTLPTNRQKNRYHNVIPFDKTRCRLSAIPGLDGSDYINANYIEGYIKGKAFLATQGPLPDTSDDFWRMVFEQKAASIVMLAQQREGGKSMCHRYWPEAGSETYGSFEVSVHAVRQYPDYTLREFKMVDTRDPEGVLHHVKQYQYTSWPSQGVPNTAAGLIDLREQVEKWQRNSGDGPIVVHCSGGCGRTGTYIATCLLIERLKTEGVVDVFQTVRALRLQRPGMVRSTEQYEFCYKAVLEYLDAFETYANFN